MTYLLSVVIPVYNAEKFVRSAIESVLGQTYSELEIVIINDGSTDSSLEILRLLEQRDPRVRLFSRGNRGLVSTLNEAFEYCHGDFILRMDADDIAEPRWAETLLKHMEKNPECDIVGSQAWSIDESDKITGIIRKPCTSAAINSHMIRNSPLIHPSIMMRKSIVSMPLYKQSDWPAEDYGAWIRVNTGCNLQNVSKTLIKYRRNKNGISLSNQDLQRRKSYELREKYLLNSFLVWSSPSERSFLINSLGWQGMASLWLKNRSHLSLFTLVKNQLITFFLTRVKYARSKSNIV